MASASKASRYFIGAHLNMAKGFHVAAEQANQVGARALGIFTGSQRAWFKKKLTAEAAENFKAACKSMDMLQIILLDMEVILLI